MREIPIDQSTFERLQLHAQPLVDTFDTVVNRALDALERDTPVLSSRPPRQPAMAPEREFDWRTPPDVSHTKLSDAVLQGQRIDRPNWNLLLKRMLILAMERLSDFDAVRSICPVNMVRGYKDDEGYRYLSEIDLSFQGASANDSLRALVTAARGLGIEFEIGFSWRQKEGAAYPGERARLKVPGRAL